MSIGIGSDKAPVAGSAYRSPGDTIPVIAAGGEKVGDWIVRSAGEQAIGLVQSLPATRMTQGDTTTIPTGDAVAVAGDELQVRVEGMFYVPAANASYSDGDLVSLVAGEMAANATGAHQVVGDYTVDGSAVTHILVKVNMVPRAAT